MHPFTNIPLGTLADDALRECRKRSKPIFERIWREGHMSRDTAYAWLSCRLGIAPSECHFGLFDAERCKEAAIVSRGYLLWAKTK